ncbi:MAG: porin [Pseudomonadota bacterium]
MKKVLLTGAIALPASVAAQAAPTLYGKANVSYQKTTDDNQDQWEPNSNSSRLGVKGDAEVTDDLTAVYKAEFEISIDDGDKKGQTFAQRNIYAGVKGNFGQVVAGKFDTPLKKARGNFDQFNSLSVSAVKHVLLKTGESKGENRMGNQIMYTSPKIAGIAQFNASLIPGEEARTDGKDGFADGKSFSVTAGDKYLKKNKYFAAVAVDDNVKGADLVRFAAQTKLPSNTKLGVLYQTAKASDVNDAVSMDSVGVSVTQAINSNVVLKAQYMQSEADTDNGQENTQFSVGTDYKLNKKTKLFGYYGRLETEKAATKAKESTIGTGLEVKF